MRLIVGNFPENYRGFLFKLYRQAGIGEHELAFAKEPNLGGFTGRVDLLGEKALNLWTGKKGIDNWRGSSLPLIGDDALRAMPTYAPDWLMANQWAIPTVVSDLKKSLAQPPEFYNLEPSVAELEEYVGQSIAFDIETAWPVSDDITMVGISSRPFHVMVVPFSEQYLPVLKRIFANAPNLISQNGLQFDGPRLEEAGFTFHPEVEEFDVMLCQHLLEPDSPHDLGFITSKYTNKPYHKDQKGLHEALYCARDVDATLQAFHVLKPLLIQHKLLDLYRYTQVPLAKICHLMTKTGIRQDPSRVAAVRERTIAEIAEWEGKLPDELKPCVLSRVHKKTGKPLKPKAFVPWRSDKCVKQYLYETLSLKPRTNSKNGRVSSDKRALASLYRQTDNPAISAIRNLKARSTLLSGFLKLEKSAKTVVHPSFNVHGTNSGRLSSSKPNFQNQPPIARTVYIPSHPEWVLAEFDYSQGENRLVAWYSNDGPRLERLAQSGFSEHKWNAATFFSMKYEDVKKDNNREAPYGMAKILTHGMGYGMGARKIAQDNELEEKFVKQLIERWRANNPLTVSWQRRTTELANKAGVLVNAFGRKRWFWSDRTYTESLAYLPQSTLADISFRAMISLMYKRINWPEWKALKVCSVLSPLPEPAQLLMQGHDALLLEFPPEIMHNACEAVKIAMEQRFPEMDGYYIPVESKVGKPLMSWGELE